MLDRWMVLYSPEFSLTTMASALTTCITCEGQREATRVRALRVAAVTSTDRLGPLTIASHGTPNVLRFSERKMKDGVQRGVGGRGEEEI